MKINNQNSYASYNNQNNKNQKVSFSGKKLDWVAKHCEIDKDNSISRELFFVLSTIFMVGARFKDARGEDEKREVLTRDIPAVAIAVFGAKKLNEGLAYAATKISGIPILQTIKNGDKTSKSFASQKQVADWYTNLQHLQNPLVTFSETIQRHGGNLSKVMNKLNLSEQLKAITGKENATNEEVITAIKKAQDAKTKNFDILEGQIKNLSKDNAVFKAAKNVQASIKVSGILMTAAILGYCLPRLNIMTTKKKYQQPQQNQQSKVAVAK